MAALPSAGFRGRALSAWAINDAVCGLCAQAALEIELEQPEAAAELRNASAHWLRHSFATHAVKYDSIRLEVLQQLLGHASITTTAGNYVDADREMRQVAAAAMAARTRL